MGVELVRRSGVEGTDKFLFAIPISFTGHYGLLLEGNSYGLLSEEIVSSAGVGPDEVLLVVAHSSVVIRAALPSSFFVASPDADAGKQPRLLDTVLLPEPFKLPFEALIEQRCMLPVSNMAAHKPSPLYGMCIRLTPLRLPSSNEIVAALQRIVPAKALVRKAVAVVRLHKFRVQDELHLGLEHVDAADRVLVETAMRQLAGRGQAFLCYVQSLTTSETILLRVHVKPGSGAFVPHVAINPSQRAAMLKAEAAACHNAEMLLAEEDEQAAKAKAKAKAKLCAKTAAAPATVAPAGDDTIRCKLTGRIMQDPVVAPDGYSYERKALEAYYARCRGDGKREPVSPATGKPMAFDMLDNRLLRTIIAELRVAQ